MSADGHSQEQVRATRADRQFIINAMDLRDMLTSKALARQLGLSYRQVRTVIEVERKRRAQRG